jgi:two-component system, OmpR family, response regulator RegX3
MRLVLLEDELDLAHTLIGWLQEAGHQVRHFTTIAKCRQELRHESFDLAIVDWCLPDGEGIDLLRWLREQSGGRREPVLFATARDSEDDIVTALAAGADDYLVKPLRQRELLARMEALLRRAAPPVDEQVELAFGPFRLQPATRCCSCHGQPIDLTEQEFAVALYLLRHLGKLLSRQHILEAVWGISADVSTRTVDTHVSRLRNKLGLRPENGYRLSSVYGFGYRLESVAPSKATA